ncbi:MAG: alpha/beta fold hydrolase [Ilumatobacteraceae bacterium]
MITRLDSPFHPWVEPHTVHRLAVGDGHVLHVEETGPTDGAPVVVLHGGPGGAIKPSYRRLLDPRRHRGVLFDQRGCGRSTPLASLTANTTADLVADCETIRRHLGIEQWTVLGGSWGSTLALAYAERHPDRVAGLVVTGVYLARDIDRWWWWDGVRFVYPEAWACLRDHVEADERDDVRAAFLRRILDGDDAVATAAAVVLGSAEAMTLDVWPDESGPPSTGSTTGADAAWLASMRVFAHYERHDHFLADGQLLAGAHRLRGVPGRIVAGRFDACTPPRGAFELAEAWGAPLEVVPCAGHRWNDPLLGRALVAAIAEVT